LEVILGSAKFLEVILGSAKFLEVIMGSATSKRLKNTVLFSNICRFADMELCRYGERVRMLNDTLLNSKISLYSKL
jgi:hypothetical protein